MRDILPRDHVPHTGCQPNRQQTLPPVLPCKAASPNEKIPPSEPTSQYPAPVGVAAIETIGLFRCIPPVLPKYPASPNAKMPPSFESSQYPRPDGVIAMPTKGP